MSFEGPYGKLTFVSSPRAISVHHCGEISIKTTCVASLLPSAKRLIAPTNALSKSRPHPRLYHASGCVSAKMVGSVNTIVRYRGDIPATFVFWYLIFGMNERYSNRGLSGGQGSSKTPDSHCTSGFGGDESGDCGDRCFYDVEMEEDGRVEGIKKNVIEYFMAIFLVYIGRLSGLGLRNRSCAMIAMFSQWAESFVANLQFPYHNALGWSFHVVYSLFLLTP